MNRGTEPEGLPIDPSQTTDLFGRPDKAHRKVVVFSGHMPDASDSSVSRFPPGHEQAVTRAVERALAHWAVGSGDLCLCGGARGGDLLFAEACLRTRAQVILLLALPIEAFIERSVRLPGTTWESRFHTMASQSTVSIVDEQPLCISRETNPFARCNDCLITMAVELSRPREPFVLLLWDGHPSQPHKPGTGDFAKKAAAISSSIVVIDPLEPA